MRLVSLLVHTYTAAAKTRYPQKRHSAFFARFPVLPIGRKLLVCAMAQYGQSSALSAHSGVLRLNIRTLVSRVTAVAAYGTARLRRAVMHERR